MREDEEIGTKGGPHRAASGEGRGRRPRVLGLALGLTLGLAGAALGLTRGEKPSGEATPSASSAPRPEPLTGKAASRQLALAEVRGSQELDLELRALQKRAEEAEGPEAWVALGRAWVRKARASADPGHYLSASAAADLALDMSPKHRGALNLRALVLHNQHRFAEARDASAKILAEDPDDLMALATLADASLELGRFDEAAKATQHRVDLKPDLPSYTRASYLRWLQGDAEGAKKIARHAIDAGSRRDPEPLAYVLVQAAMFFWHEGDYGGAEKGFDRALEVFPGYPPALVGKGRAALAKGEAARAAALFARAERGSPLAETSWLLGDAHRAAGDPEGAEEAYARVVREGRSGDARTLALFYAVKNREAAEALRLAEQESRERRDVHTRDALAWALFRAGRLEEAERESEAILRLGIKEAMLLYHAGAIRIALGKKAEGERLVREALRRNPSFDATSVAEAEALLGGPKTASGRRP